MTKIGKTARSLCALAVLAIGLPAFALVSVQSSVDRDSVGVGEDLVFTLTVISDGAIDAQPPRPSDLNGFQLIETWDATAVSQKLMPGPHGMDFQTQRTREFNYRLQATSAGRRTIGAFDISVDGKKYSTQPIVIDVTSTPQGGRPQKNRPSAQRGNGFPDLDDLDQMDRAEEELFRQLLQRRGIPGTPGGGFGAPRPPPAHRTLPVNPNEAFFVQVEADKTEVYEGEQITVSWYIYTRGQMETLDRVKFPDLKGFWKEIIEEVPTIQFTDEIVNGVPYKKALLASHALFPLKAGTAVIDEYKIKSRVRMLNQGGFGLGPAYEYTRSSQRLPVKVKALPVDGRPSSFSGAVGQFDVNAVVETTQVPVNQPFSMRVRFEGSGNAKGIELPAIEWPKTVELYDTKSESRFFKNGRSFKEFNLLVIPRAEGELEIPAFEVGMFNPETGKYYTRKTSPIKLQVIASAAGAAPPAQRMNEPSPAPKAPPPGQTLPEPIVAFRGGGVGAGFFNRPSVWAALYLGVVLMLVFKARMELGGRARRRDLREILNRRFKALDKTVKSGDLRAIGTEMTNLFSLVLGDVAGGGGASEEVGKVLERMPPSVRRDFGGEILKKHEVFQVLAFAPTEALGPLKDPERVRKEVEDSKELLGKIVKSAVEDENAS